MANKPQLTFARIVSGTVDTNGIGTESVAITQAPVTVAVASTTATTIATTVSTTNTTTTTIASATTSSPIIDVSITAMESGNHTSSTTPGGSCVIALAVPHSSGKNKDGLHQRFVEERKPDSNGNAHVQRSIQSGPHQQIHYHQQIQRRNKPRPKNDRSRKDNNMLSVGKEENETHTEQQPEVILGPAPLPTVNAWFKHSITETKQSKKESDVLNPQISSAEEEVNSLSLKKMDAEKDNVIKSVTQETLTSTGENNSKKMAKSPPSCQTTKQEKQVDTEAANVDDKAWPSLNEAVNEELKPDSAINNVITKGIAVNHEVMKVTDSSEAVYYTDMKQDKDKENENNGNGGKNNKSGKAWKKLDIDVDYTGREGQGRRGNIGPGNKNDHPQRNRYLDTASNGFYYQLEGNQGWKKKADSDGDFVGTYHHYHSIPSIRGQKPMITAVPVIPFPTYQPKIRNQKTMNTNPPQRFLIYDSTSPFFHAEICYKLR